MVGDVESDAFPVVHDRKLEALLQVWADLPESVKDALLVMVSDRSRSYHLRIDYFSSDL